MKFQNIIPITTLIILFSSCSNESTSDLIDSTPISENVTFTNDIKSTIDNNCISCHGTTPTSGAPMSLTTYENVRDAVLQRGLIDRISRENGEAGLMPENGPRLPQTLIDEVVQWEAQGLQQ